MADTNTLHTAPATLTQTVNPAKGESYDIVWHVTKFATRAKAHKALRAEGYTFVRPSQRGGRIPGTGYWTRFQSIGDSQTAVVVGTTVHAR